MMNVTELSIKQFHFACLAFLLLLTSCSTLSESPTVRKPYIENQLNALEQGLKLETWDKVQVFFAQGYYGGYEALRRRLEARWRNEDLVDIQFIVNKVLESDGLLNASVRWHMSYMDQQGRPHKRSGESEILLKPRGDSFLILHIKGDSFL